jgi:hypothetical protein
VSSTATPTAVSQPKNGAQRRVGHGSLVAYGVAMATGDLAVVADAVPVPVRRDLAVVADAVAVAVRRVGRVRIAAGSIG